MSSAPKSRLECTQLRWQCDPSLFSFETTAELEITDSLVGQETARDALLFGIECLAHGQNVYVRGPRGTGRITMVRQLLRQLQMKTKKKRDRCFVNNFLKPDRPRLITLPPGTANEFRKAMSEFAEFVRKELRKLLDSEPLLSQREAAKERIHNLARHRSDPLETRLANAGLALVSIPQGPTVIFPLVDGEPIPPDQLKTLIAQGKISSELLENYERQLPNFQKDVERVSREIGQVYREGKREIDSLKQMAARALLGAITGSILMRFNQPAVKTFIDEAVQDVVENQLDGEEDEEPADLDALYGVNIVLTHAENEFSPVVEEVVPNVINLLGTVDLTFSGEQAVSDFRGIRAGALLQADAGYLIVDVEDLLSEPGAYRALMRTLRTRRLEIVPPEMGFMRPYVVVQPEPIDVEVRVILVGDVDTYYQLDAIDPDFQELFKVLADFDDEIPRDSSGLQQYAIVLSRLAKEEGLLPFHRSGVAALAEHGARVVAREGRLTAKFGRISDIAREAAFLASKDNAPHVRDNHVWQVIRRTKQRANLPSRRFQDYVTSGTIRVATSGSEVGQINGLAVIHSGPLTYGFPARITATIGPGTAGLINIEGRARMSGAIHSKGFHILGGLLRHLLSTDHPLSFSASLAFEQSYGGIDGDSASGAETVCLLSALTGIPISQSLAMTGAIDQLGHIQAIGGVNEKIEGFFDICHHFGLNGEQGVVIPRANAGDLMLRADVVAACRAGRFHVYAVDTIHEALELFTGIPAGQSTTGRYPAGSVLAVAVQRAHEFWQKTLSAPQRMTQVASGEAFEPNSTTPPGEMAEKPKKGKKKS
jgi:ATP-dependent Lon protease